MRIKALSMKGFWDKDSPRDLDREMNALGVAMCETRKELLFGKPFWISVPTTGRCPRLEVWTKTQWPAICGRCRRLSRSKTLISFSFLESAFMPGYPTLTSGIFRVSK